MKADPAAAFRAELVAEGLLIPTGVNGLYGRSGRFEEIVERLNALITCSGTSDGAEVMRFPPAVNRQHFENSEYLKTFPHLAGTVHSFVGNEPEHMALLAALERGEDWTAWQKATEVVMTPAACYPVYPTLANRGWLTESGALVDVLSYCFRHEPSLDPTRMQLFRQREFVRLGTPDQITQFRECWIERAQRLVQSLGIPLRVTIANDAFFGRTGKLLREKQLEQQLKVEVQIPIVSEAQPTACISINHHRSHFGRLWSICTHDGEIAHSACVGFGLERIALALFRHHGFQVKEWPTAVHEALSKPLLPGSIWASLTT